MEQIRGNKGGDVPHMKRSQQIVTNLDTKRALVNLRTTVTVRHDKT
jgi:hypothetical protein